MSVYQIEQYCIQYRKLEQKIKPLSIKQNSNKQSNNTYIKR